MFTADSLTISPIMKSVFHFSWESSVHYKITMENFTAGQGNIIRPDLLEGFFYAIYQPL